MAAMTETDWHAEALRLKAEGKVPNEIAEIVGRSASQVRRVLAQADSNGAGDGEQTDIESALQTIRSEAGEPVGPMPPRPPEQPETVYVEEIRIDGTTQYALNVGGKQPQTCEITFSGKAVVDGFLRKGDRLKLKGGTVLVTFEGAKDKLDKQTGIVTECVQQHRGQIVDLVVAS